MGTVTNLNRFRKKQARKQKAQQAERNRRLHGLSKAERQQQRKQEELDTRRLEGHHLTPGGEPPKTESD